jgi:hypothetical protein
MEEDNKQANIRTKYQVSISLFASEGQIQWLKYAAMLTVNLILVTVLGAILNDNRYHKLLLGGLRFAPLIGIFICVIWLLMTVQGFYWMDHWIKSANILEQDLKGGDVSPIVAGGEKQGVGLTRKGAYIIIVFFMAAYIYLNFVI